MSRLYFLWNGPEKDQAHLEITEKELEMIITWAEFKKSEVGASFNEEKLIKNLKEMRIKNDHRLIK